MQGHSLSVREIEEGDIPSIVGYWLDSDQDFLVSIGVDLAKVPSRDDLTMMLQTQLGQDYPEKQSYCIIWEIDGTASGHCNAGEIEFGRDAFLHLHMWNSGNRKRGSGAKLLSLSLPYFFRNLQLDNIFSEPYAQNPAPSKTLEKSGFNFVMEYETIPGSINFQQSVKRWILTRVKFEKTFGKL